MARSPRPAPAAPRGTGGLFSLAATFDLFGPGLGRGCRSFRGQWCPGPRGAPGVGKGAVAGERREHCLRRWHQQPGSTKPKQLGGRAGRSAGDKDTFLTDPVLRARTPSNKVGETRPNSLGQQRSYVKTAGPARSGGPGPWGQHQPWPLRLGGCGGHDPRGFFVSPCLNGEGKRGRWGSLCMVLPSEAHFS